MFRSGPRSGIGGRRPGCCTLCCCTASFYLDTDSRLRRHSAASARGGRRTARPRLILTKGTKSPPRDWSGLEISQSKNLMLAPRSPAQQEWPPRHLRRESHVRPAAVTPARKARSRGRTQFLPAPQVGQDRGYVGRCAAAVVAARRARLRAGCVLARCAGGFSTPGR